MWLWLQEPIVYDVVRQPPVTPEITYAQVIVGAFVVAALFILIAVLGGLIVGGTIVFFKKQQEKRGVSPHDTGHVRLRM